MRSHLLFVTGMPRSGTTLLSALLGRHPHILATPETHFFSQCIPQGSLRAELSREAAAQLAACLVRYVEQGGGPPFDIEVEACSAADVFAMGLGGLCEALGMREVDWVVEKTPAHHGHVERIARVFPSARFLTIVRDPRSVSASLQRVPWNPEPAFHHARRWRAYAEQTLAYQRQLGERYRWIRYEDVLAEGPRVLADLCAWLEVEYDDRLLDSSGKTTAFDAAREPWKANAVRPMDASRVGAWREELDAADQWLVERGAEGMLVQMGYKPQARLNSPGTVARVAWRLGTYPPKRLQNKLRYLYDRYRS